MKTYGHIKLSRKAFAPVDGDKLWHERREFSRWEAWVYLIQLAQWKPTTLRSKHFGDVRLERGEFVASQRTLAEQFGWSRKKTRLFLGALTSDQYGARLRAIREAQAGTVYLIVNYDTYQSGDEKRAQQKAQPRASEGPSEGPKNKQLSSTTPNGVVESGDSAWPSRWAFDSAQRFLAHSVVIPVDVLGKHAKPVKDTIPWPEWLRVIDRMAAHPDIAFGFPTMLRQLKAVRDNAQLDPNRPLTLEEAMGL